ncbi:hypothetical protein GDO78_016711, partial [Eleutherodactylus coqui]
GAKFVHNIEAVFSQGDEVVHITQVADGFDSDNYIHLRTTIKGKIPYIPETSTVQINPYYEIYQYSGSVVTSTAYREYTVTSANNEVQRLSYRLKQNITYQDCSHSQRFPPTAQKLAVDRMFALYNKDEKVLRFAITSHIGSVHDSPPEQGSPCFDGTHMCDTKAHCQPTSGLNYTCVCAPGYQGDGRDCNVRIVESNCMDIVQFSLTSRSSFSFSKLKENDEPYQGLLFQLVSRSENTAGV